MVILAGLVKDVGFGTESVGKTLDVLTSKLRRTELFDILLELVEAIDRLMLEKLDELTPDHSEGIGDLSALLKLLLERGLKRVEQKIGGRLVVTLVIIIKKNPELVGLIFHMRKKEARMVDDDTTHNGRVCWVREVGNSIHTVIDKMLGHVAHEEGKVSSFLELGVQSDGAVGVGLLILEGPKLVRRGMHQRCIWVEARPIGLRLSTSPGSPLVSANLDKVSNHGFWRAEMYGSCWR